MPGRVECDGCLCPTSRGGWRTSLPAAQDGKRRLASCAIQLQNTEWTKKLASALKWLKRGSPYYNLISDESQVWQGAHPAGHYQGWAAASNGQRHAFPGCWLPGMAANHLHAGQVCNKTPQSASPAELNLAYSQHEIVSDYVRPTLM